MIRINLLPVRAARKRENIRRQVSVFLLSVVLVVIIMGKVTSGLGREISELKGKVEDAEAEMLRLEAINKKVEEIKKRLATLKAKRDVIDKLEANRSGPVAVMEELTRRVVAEKMWLNSLSESGGKMTLLGMALDNKTIADFMKELEESPYFGTVDLISSQQVSMGAMKFMGFTITCAVLSPKAPKEAQT